MAYLDNFNPEKIDSVPEIRQQFRFLKKAIDNGEIGSGGGGAVDSVNGKTGAVVLDATDVGAASAEELQGVADSVATNTQDIATNAQDIATLQAAYEGLTQSDIVPLDTLPASGETNTIYRVAGTDSYTDYMWDGNDFVPMATYSGMFGEGVYDISADNSDATYDNLTAALGASGANVPSAIRSGGMSIKYLENVYADYDVVVTEGLTTEPTGTELDTALTLTDGTYKAAELASVSTLPTNPYNSVLYYVDVAGDTTTYTQWVITKKTNDSTKYVHWTYTSSSVENADFVNLDNWVGSLEDKAETIARNVEDVNYTSYALTEKYYIAHQTGVVTSNASWRGTGYIPVKEGDEFYYSGNPGTVSLGAAGYAYDGNTYTYKSNLIPKGNTNYKEEIIVIPKGITHIYATTGSSSVATASLIKKNTSVLSDIEDGFDGNISGNEVITGYTWNGYVGTNGTFNSTTSYANKSFYVEAGDIIELYNIQVSNLNNVAVLAKKISETPTFKTLIQAVDTNYHNYKYTAQESMTVCVSCSSVTPRLTLVRKNKIKGINTRLDTLEANQVTIFEKNDWLDEYDYKLGYMFNSIAVIGDSMSVGSISTESSAAPDANAGASWLSDLAKRWGCKSRMHYAQGGASCYSWLNSTVYGLGIMLADTRIYNAYFIAMGHNDSASVGAATDTAATVTISGTTPSCADGNTFCAYYKAVINQIRTKAPHAMIFCLSEYDDVMTSSHSTYSQAVKDIAELYYTNGDTLVHHLDTGGVPVSGMGLGTHYSTIGYFHIAKRIDEEANKVIWNHRTDIAIKEFGIYNNDNNKYEGYVTQ